MSRVFTHFEEIEEDLKTSGPPLVYKYRTWTDENHKKLLQEKSLWFSHPFALNDPLDVRPRAVFNIFELQDPRFFAKLLATAQTQDPSLKTEVAIRHAAEKQLLFLKQNPDAVLQNWNNYNRDQSNFDQYGIFSTAMTSLSPGLWERYGDMYSGYCIGFDTVELCRSIQSGYGCVIYSDEPYQYSFFEDTDKRDLYRLYLKKTAWSYEEEFRFITVGVGVYSTRLQHFNKMAVKELTIGHNSTYESEIIKAFNLYFNGLPIFKTILNRNGQLSRIQIQ